MSEEEKVVQDNEPLWKKQGFESPEAAFEAISQQNEDLKGQSVAEKARADTLERELGKGSTPQMPVWDDAAYEEDPSGYSKSYQSKVKAYENAKQAGTERVSKATLEATLNSVLARATEKGYDEDVMQGVIRSMVRKDPSKRSLLDSPDGIRELGKQAMEKLQGQRSPQQKKKSEVDDDGTEDGEMGDRVPKEHQDRPGRASTGPRQSTPRTSEVERLSQEIATGVTERKLRGADLVGKVIEQNLAHLGVEKPKR